jgi:hypothetical protein
MPAIPNKKFQNKQPRRPLYRQAPFWILVAAALAAVASIAAPRIIKYQNEKTIAADRLRFAQAEKDVQKVSEAIVAAAGQPFHTISDKSCFEPSTKFEERLISCSVYKELYYPITSPENAGNISEILSSKIQSYWPRENIRTSPGIEEFQFKPANNGSDQKVFEVYKNQLVNMTCRVTYALYGSNDSGSTDAISSSTDPYTLRVSLSCGDSAKSLIYPLR